MKCCKPNTDQQVDITILAKGIPCDEYDIPSDSAFSNDDNVIETFIPVSEGDQLTIRGTFTGSCLHGSFDLLADGSFVADKRIEGAKAGDVKLYQKRKLDFKSVFDAPREAGRTSIFSSDKCVEGNLHVKALRDAFSGLDSEHDGDELGVGTLTVVISLNQRTEDNYTSPYASATIGDWAAATEAEMAENDVWAADKLAEMADGGIVPTYELEMQNPNEDVSKARQGKHHRHFKQTRFGEKPWARLIFYYRSKEAIEEAECVKRDEKPVELEPGNAEQFIYGSTETKKTPAKKGKKADDEGSAVAAQPSRHNSIFNTPPPSETPKATPAPAQRIAGDTTPPPPPTKTISAPNSSRSPTGPQTPSGTKKKLFGNTLNLPNSLSSSPMHQQFIANHQSSDPFSSAIEEYEQVARKSEQDRQQRQQLLTFADFTFRPDDKAANYFLQSVGSDGDADNFLAAMSQPAAPVAQMVTPQQPVADNGDMAMRDGDVNAVAAEKPAGRVKEEEPISPSHTTFSAQPEPPQSADPPVDATAQTVQVQPDTTQTTVTSPQPSSDTISTQRACTLTLDQIRQHIPLKGIKIFDLKDLFDDDVLPQSGQAATQFVSLVRKVAYQKGDRYYLKPAAASQSQKSEVERSSQLVESKVDHVTGDKAPEREGSKPIETSNDLSTTATTDIHKSTPATSNNLPTSPSSLKRSSSTMETSRESTPLGSKKPKFDEASSKRANLLRQLEEKRQKKAAAKKALESQQALREAEEKRREEAEAKEMEMLQKMMQEEDQELEELERLKGEEEKAAEEAREGWERAEGAVRMSEGL